MARPYNNALKLAIQAALRANIHETVPSLSLVSMGGEV